MKISVFSAPSRRTTTSIWSASAARTAAVRPSTLSTGLPSTVTKVSPTSRPATAAGPFSVTLWTTTLVSSATPQPSSRIMASTKASTKFITGPARMTMNRFQAFWALKQRSSETPSSSP